MIRHGLKISISSPVKITKPDEYKAVEAFRIAKYYLNRIGEHSPNCEDLVGRYKKHTEKYINIAWCKYKKIPQYVSYLYPTSLSIESRLRVYKDKINDIEKEIRDQRSIDKVLRKKSKVVHGHEYYLLGGVHCNKGDFTRIAKAKNRSMLDQDKSPEDNSQYVGVEIEFISMADREEMRDYLVEAGLSKICTIKDDGSLRLDPDRRGYEHEITILAKQTEYRTAITNLCSLINTKAVGAYVNNTCSVHVHIDVRHLRYIDKEIFEAAYTNLAACQHILYSMCPVYRKLNKYCKPVPRMALKIRDSRYYGINARSIERHGTIEVRIHSGTTNADKIINWVDILLRIAYAKKIPAPIKTLSKFCAAVPVTYALLGYIKSRMSKFKDGHAKREDTNQNILLTANDN